MELRTEDAKTPLISADDPFALFDTWFTEAKASEPNNPNAMLLATVDETGMPDARVVLLKDVGHDGFTFYTNTLSSKGLQLGGQPKAALCFFWKSLDRQVRVRGPVAPVSAAEADAYFATRPRGSQIGAWASRQSEVLPTREHFLTEIERIDATYEGQDVPRPPHWSGYRVTPLRIEFWQERPFRLHDRLVFSRTDAAQPWDTGRVFP